MVLSLNIALHFYIFIVFFIYNSCTLCGAGGGGERQLVLWTSRGARHVRTKQEIVRRGGGGVDMCPLQCKQSNQNGNKKKKKKKKSETSKERERRIGMDKGKEGKQTDSEKGDRDCGHRAQAPMGVAEECIFCTTEIFSKKGRGSSGFLRGYSVRVFPFGGEWSAYTGGGYSGCVRVCAFLHSPFTRGPNTTVRFFSPFCNKQASPPCSGSRSSESTLRST